MLEICFGAPAVGGEHTSHKCTHTPIYMHTNLRVNRRCLSRTRLGSFSFPLAFLRLSFCFPLAFLQMSIVYNLPS